MTISAGELAAESLEAPAVFRSAELIAGQRARQMNEVLAGHGIGFRVFMGHAQLTEAAMALAEVQICAISDDEQDAEVSRATRALDLTQHHILFEVLAARVQRMERALVAAVGAFRAVNEVGVKSLGLDIEGWVPSPEFSALFGGAQ